MICKYCGKESNRERPICFECGRVRDKQKRGRTMEEMEEIGRVNLPPVRVLSREEIAKIAHTITPPVKKQRGTYYRI
jgi:uncharacterized membrane protein YvbJ